ncbi:hypothetical protein MPLB_2040036 [Mesorhizobium sp. ORS 3324]|nr:hypothetical protein MPLB_2040036 [Mesorhizobium sp. ORS 3324]
MVLDDHISMARRHVREGERHIARQQDRIVRLRSKNLPTADASKFLRLLKEVHALQRQHLSQLLSKSPSSQKGSEISAGERQEAQGSSDFILISDPIVRLALELGEELDKIKLKWLTAKAPKGKLH